MREVQRLKVDRMVVVASRYYREECHQHRCRLIPCGARIKDRRRDRRMSAVRDGNHRARGGYGQQRRRIDNIFKGSCASSARYVEYGLTVRYEAKTAT